MQELKIINDGREGTNWGDKSTLCVAAAKAAGIIVSIQHTTCSALWRGFDTPIRDWETYFSINCL